MEKAFLADGGRFELQKISQVFQITTPKKKINANTVTAFDGHYPYVVRTEKNNGIRGYIDEDPKFLNPANTISFGQDTATMFYQPNPYFTGDKIKIFSLVSGCLNRFNAAYLIAAMSKAFSLFSWGSSSFDEKVLKNVEINLPIQNSGIAFGYMESVVQELQAERLQELQAYLQATGLSDYILSKQEKSALDLLENVNAQGG